MGRRVRTVLRVSTHAGPLVEVVLLHGEEAHVVGDDAKETASFVPALTKMLDDYKIVNALGEFVMQGLWSPKDPMSNLLLLPSSG